LSESLQDGGFGYNLEVGTVQVPESNAVSILSLFPFRTMLSHEVVCGGGFTLAILVIPLEMVLQQSQGGKHLIAADTSHAQGRGELKQEPLVGFVLLVSAEGKGVCRSEELRAVCGFATLVFAIEESSRMLVVKQAGFEVEESLAEDPTSLDEGFRSDVFSSGAMGDPGDETTSRVAHASSMTTSAEVLRISERSIFLGGM
jgi:hypothetical protein